MANKKLFNNKKAITEFFLDIWSYLVFIVAIFFFMGLFRYETATDQRQLEGIKESTIASSTLISYLRTPITLDGKNINIAELIRLWQSDPDKYKDVLEKNSAEILNSLEYEYQDPTTKNTRIRGFDVSINSRKKEDKSLNYLLESKSKSFENGFCILNEYGCIIIEEQFLPITGDKSLYLVLMESQKAK